MASRDSAPFRQARPDSSISKRRAAARHRGGEAYTRRRAEIVAAATAVFRDKGFEAATLADVAAAVGVDRATLYFYISSKQEILDEIVTDVVNAQLVAAEGIAVSKAPASVKLGRLVTELTGFLGANHRFLHYYLEGSAVNTPEAAPEGGVDLRGARDRYESTVRTVVQQGVDDGSFRADLDVHMVSIGLLGMVCRPHRWLTPQTSLTEAAAVADAYVDVLLNGLVPRDAGDEPVPDRQLPHPDVTALLERFAKADVPLYSSLSVPEARAQLQAVTRLQNPPEAVASVEDLRIEGAGWQVPARVYRPRVTGLSPLVVYLHGGGWVLGNLDVADAPCRALTNAAPCVVVSVDYRLAPEVRFPGPLEDCVRAVRWVAEHAKALGGSDRLVLVGDSAGGNLAAATSTVLRDEGGPAAAAQVLIYPTLAPASTTSFESYQTFSEGPFMTRRELDWFWDHYLRGPQDATDPLAAPLHAEDVSGLPETTVVVAGLDPLHDEGVAYAAKLAAAGVPVQLIHIAGAAHGFWWMDRVMSQAAELTSTLASIVRGDGTDTGKPEVRQA